MKLTIRLERPEDYREVEALTREAFWGVFHPTCDEHYLVHKLRNSRDFVPALDMVAESDGRIVGHILYTKARVTDAAGRENEVLTFGPLSVLPAYWKRGIGTALMRATIDRARELGYRGIVIFGHPDYYCRVGFRPAGEFGIVTGQGDAYDAFMALPLYPGALDGIAGVYRASSDFEMDEAAAKAFDNTFPPKAPADMAPIDTLLKRLAPPARRAIETLKLPALNWLSRFSGREIRALEGMDDAAMEQINAALREQGMPEKEEGRSPLDFTTRIKNEKYTK